MLGDRAADLSWLSADKPGHGAGVYQTTVEQDQQTKVFLSSLTEEVE